MTPEEINAAIDEILSSCDSIATPAICRKMMTEAGKNYVKARIIHLVVNENVRPVEAALAHIEQKLTGM